jgi:hypothetical protein
MQMCGCADDNQSKLVKKLIQLSLPIAERRLVRHPFAASHNLTTLVL